MATIERRKGERLAITSELLLQDEAQLRNLSAKYNIPERDIMLIALNASGVKFEEVENDRGRFKISFPDGQRYFLALTITDKPFSNFEHDGERILFNGKEIAKATTIEEDTCTDSYWRRGGKALTLNSNSRSNCAGCAFCGTYSLKEDDKALDSVAALQKKARELAMARGSSLTGLETIGIVTGCFPSEEKVVEHLLNVREAFATVGFSGEISYIGSQLRNREMIKEVVDSGPFSLYLTVEAFEDRDKIMRRDKASLDLRRGREVLGTAKALGAETSYLYITGLDSLQSMKRQMPKYEPVLTRLPQLQTFQAYTPDQIQHRRPEAADIEYFLQARKIAEAAYPNLSPIVGNNYRSLWYTTYRQHQLPEQSI